jgi:hypothetical protein
MAHIGLSYIWTGIALIAMLAALCTMGVATVMDKGDRSGGDTAKASSNITDAVYAVAIGVGLSICMVAILAVATYSETTSSAHV